MSCAAHSTGMIACSNAVMKKAYARELTSTSKRRQRGYGCIGCAKQVDISTWLLAM
eukprot:CAMPEP_0115864208 /NCGR_PEP_ID=MMETSP0287-20121206/19080_1 /TAXON_ID=412157 /ORGANISM="Chrysochromulina rotalis, Strain UIO044" /LENGTH=55 /DNA_ID=CAMNT_0003318667 /DNA_START=573 /DNA_END=740 /DNA_ORIENTATION=+